MRFFTLKAVLPPQPGQINNKNQNLHKFKHKKEQRTLEYIERIVSYEIGRY